MQNPWFSRQSLWPIASWSLHLHQCLEQQPSPYNPFSVTLQNSTQSTGGSVVAQEVVGGLVCVVEGGRVEEVGGKVDVVEQQV